MSRERHRFYMPKVPIHKSPILTPEMVEEAKRIRDELAKKDIKNVIPAKP